MTSSFTVAKWWMSVVHFKPWNAVKCFHNLLKLLKYRILRFLPRFTRHFCRKKTPSLNQLVIIYGYIIFDKMFPQIATAHQPDYTVSGKKRPRYFQLQLSHFLVDFYNFCTIGNRSEYLTTICNLLTYMLDDVITVRHRRSWKFSSW